MMLLFSILQQIAQLSELENLYDSNTKINTEVYRWNLRTANFFPRQAKSARLVLEGEIRRSLIELIELGRTTSSLSYGGIRLICTTIFTTKQKSFKSSSCWNYLIKQKKNYIQYRKFTLVSTSFPPIPACLRAINKIWLEASMSNTRAPATRNSFYKVQYEVNIEWTTKRTMECNSLIKVMHSWSKMIKIDMHKYYLGHRKTQWNEGSDIKICINFTFNCPHITVNTSVSDGEVEKGSRMQEKI